MGPAQGGVRGGVHHRAGPLHAGRAAGRAAGHSELLSRAAVHRGGHGAAEAERLDDGRRPVPGAGAGGDGARA